MSFIDPKTELVKRCTELEFMKLSKEEQLDQITLLVLENNRLKCLIDTHHKTKEIEYLNKVIERKDQDIINLRTKLDKVLDDMARLQTLDTDSVCSDTSEITL